MTAKGSGFKYTCSPTRPTTVTKQFNVMIIVQRKNDIRFKPRSIQFCSSLQNGFIHLFVRHKRCNLMMNKSCSSKRVKIINASEGARSVTGLATIGSDVIFKNVENHVTLTLSYLDIFLQIE